MSEERFARIEARQAELRDLIGTEVTKVHNRINVEVQPRGPAWWVRPATVTIYTVLACGVLAVATAGWINWDYIIQSAGFAEGVVR